MPDKRHHDRTPQRPVTQPSELSEHGRLEHSTLTQGQSLDVAVRTAFEPRFQHTFAEVRVFADDEAARVTSAVNARALNHGRDLIFNRGEYRPDTLEGQAVLAHELAHVVQRDRFSRPSPGVAATPGDAAETDAHAASAAVLAGRDAHVSAAPTANVAPLLEGLGDVTKGIGLLAGTVLGSPASPDPTANTPPRRVVSVGDDPWAGEARYSFALGKRTLNDVDANTAIERLLAHRESLRDNTIMKQVHRNLIQNREEHSIVGFWADTLGGADLPAYEDWDNIEHELYKVRVLIKSPKVNDRRIREAIALLEHAERRRDDLERRIEAYSHDTVKGAERAVTGLEAVRDTSKMVVDVASGGKLGAVYGGVQQVAQQTSEVAYGQRDSVDFKGIAVNVAVDQLTGMVTGKIGAGNAVAKKFGNSAVGKIAGTVVGEVVDQKVGSAVGIGTNAVVANAAGLENAPSLSQVGGQLWDNATSLDAGELAKGYAMGKVAKGVAGSHPGAQGSPDKVNEAASKPSSAPPQDAPKALDASKGAPQSSPAHAQMIAAQAQAAMAMANRTHATLEARKASAADGAAQRVDDPVPTGQEAPLASTSAPVISSESSANQTVAGASSQPPLFHASEGGTRGSTPLTGEQFEHYAGIAQEMGMPRDNIQQVSNSPTSYGPTFDQLLIGPDINPLPLSERPADLPNPANAMLEPRAVLGHEIIGHREAAQADQTHHLPWAEEAQASFRAALHDEKLAPEQRQLLIEDAAARFRHQERVGTVYMYMDRPDASGSTRGDPSSEPVSADPRVTNGATVIVDEAALGVPAGSSQTTEPSHPEPSAPGQTPPSGPGAGPVRRGPIPDEQPASLNEQLALHEARAGGDTGWNAGSRVAMTRDELADVPRLEDNYGPGDWTKMQYVRELADGSKINLHWFRNQASGQDVEFKYISGEVQNPRSAERRSMREGGHDLTGAVPIGGRPTQLDQRRNPAPNAVRENDLRRLISSATADGERPSPTAASATHAGRESPLESGGYAGANDFLRRALLGILNDRAD